MIFNKIKQHNRNKLLWRDESVDGMKTGHTEAAGYCLVASAKRKDMRLIAIVMGTTERTSQSQRDPDTAELWFPVFRDPSTLRGRRHR